MKFRKQAEHAQSLATERANEREKSLQEVVIQERNRLARELHDSVSQQLFAVSIYLSAQPDIEVIAEADDGGAAVEKALALKPNIIIDGSCHEGNGWY